MDWIEIVITIVLLGAGLIGNIRKKARVATSEPDFLDEPHLWQEPEKTAAAGPDPEFVSDLVEEAPQATERMEEPKEVVASASSQWSKEELKKLVLYSELMKPKFEES